MVPAYLAYPSTFRRWSDTIPKSKEQYREMSFLGVKMFPFKFFIVRNAITFRIVTVEVITKD